VRTLLVALALAASTTALAQATPAPKAPPAAETREPTAWELDAYVGYGQIAWPMPDRSTLAWGNGGPAFALTVAYRGAHFTHPFFDISYVPIYSSGQYVNTIGNSAIGTVYARNSAAALGFVVGAGWDIDWFRLRVGLGLYDQIVTTNVTAVTRTSTGRSSARRSSRRRRAGGWRARSPRKDRGRTG